MSTERAEAIVLRTLPVTETSLLVVWFAREFGKLKTLAKGARRLQSPLRGRLDLFYTDEIVFWRSRRSELHLLRDAYLERARPGIRRSVEQVAAASAACRLVEEMVALEDAHAGVFEDLGATLDELERTANWTMVMWLQLRMLRVGGWEPRLLRNDGVGRMLQSLGAAGAEGVRRVHLTAEQLQASAEVLDRFMETHLGRRLPWEGAPWREVWR
jgi:DNA repair protein RecO (recombination protein O)